MPAPRDRVSTSESRTYRILGVIGQGGHGRVYRARLQGPGGFERDVALKLLRSDVAEGTIARLRDEARLLGLVRDRAIVAVDPPVQVDRQWALVMEYVDGASAARLLRRGVFPPGVALEVVQELARVLDKVWTLPGPDGRPLELVHRDVKPGNVQITRHGEVKLLDFGIARARTRPSQPGNVEGTAGYMAPEQARGDDGPASDVYSLGVMLVVLVSGLRATEIDTPDAVERPPDDADLAAVLALAERMRAEDASGRPTAREVEEACRELRARIGGPSLWRWAEEAVPQAVLEREDERVGTVLTETIRAAPDRGRRPMAFPVAIGGAGAAVGLGLGSIGLGLALVAVALSWETVTLEEAEALLEPVPVQVDAQPGAVEPGPPADVLVAPAEPASAPEAPERPVPRPDGKCAGAPGALLGYANVRSLGLGRGSSWAVPADRPVYRDLPAEDGTLPTPVVCTLSKGTIVRIDRPPIRVPKMGVWVPIVGGSLTSP